MTKILFIHVGFVMHAFGWKHNHTQIFFLLMQVKVMLTKNSFLSPQLEL